MTGGDLQLYQRWKREGDAEAFRELARRHAAMVFAACRRILRNASDAEEVAQECFESLATSSAEPKRNLAAWLHAQATHRSIDRIKADSRRNERERIAAQQHGDSCPAAWDDVYEHIDAAIAELPERLREPIVEYFLEGETHTAIAARVNLSRQTITHRIGQGIEEVRKKLRDRGIITTTSALAAMLMENGAEAAPSTLISALGKLALSGGWRHAAQGSVGALLMKAAAVALVAVAGATSLYIISTESTQPVKQIAAAADTANAEPNASNDAGAAGQQPEVPSWPPQTEPEPADAFKGAVVDGLGEPADGATVIAAVADEVLAKAVTEEDGSFRLANLTGGRYDLYAFKDRAGLAIGAADVPADNGVTLQLQPLGRVSGRVYDKASGAPVKGLTMNLSDWSYKDKNVSRALRFREALGIYHGDDPICRTDEQGLYEFANLLPTKYTFRIDEDFGKTDYAFPGFQNPPIHIQVAYGESISDLDFALDKGGTIFGRVLDANENLIPGAELYFFPSKHSYFGAFRHESRDGTFRFRGLPPAASYRVYATHNDYAPIKSEPVAIPEGGTTKEVDVVLVKGHAASGRLIDDGGRPVSGATVAFEGGRGPRTTTDGTGAFSFDHVAPGKHELWIHTENPAYQSNSHLHFEMPKADAHHDIELILTRLAKGSVSGRVTQPNGLPVAGARVVAAGQGPPPERIHVSREVRTDSNGRYRLDNLGTASMVSVATYPDGFGWERRHDVPVGSTSVDFVVHPVGQVQGRVITADNAEPVTSFEIRKVRIREERYGEQEYPDAWIPVDSGEGRFRLTDVQPPSVRLEVRSPGYAPGATEKIAVRPEGVVEDVKIELDIGAAIAGTVIHSVTGEPITGANIRVFFPLRFNFPLLRDREDPMGYDYSALTLSNSDGAFSLSSLTPGKAVGLVVWKEGLETYVTQLTPRAKTDESLKIELGPEGTLHMSPVGNHPPPRDRIAVRISRTDTHESPSYRMSAWLVLAGEWKPVELAGLPAGLYDVVIDASGEELAEHAVEIQSGSTVTLEVDTAALQRAE